MKKAYRRLAVRHHPGRNIGDKAGATVRFPEVNEAYKVLLDAASTGEYDQSLDRSGGGGGGRGGGRSGNGVDVFEKKE